MKLDNIIVLNILETLRDIFSLHPVLSPYFMFAPETLRDIKFAPVLGLFFMFALETLRDIQFAPRARLLGPFFLFALHILIYLCLHCIY